MNVQEYISSGVVESYVLGLLSEEERHEFEQLREQYPELKAAQTAFELTLEKNAMLNAIEPPRELKNKVLGQITLNSKAARSGNPYQKIQCRLVKICRCCLPGPFSCQYFLEYQPDE